jgi:hypothetical protein
MPRAVAWEIFHLLATLDGQQHMKGATIVRRESSLFVKKNNN